jgi:thioesterase domain-containing protein
MSHATVAPAVSPIQTQCLAPLQTGGADRPLFCIHGLGGNIAAMIPLARCFVGKRPVYGLLGLGLDPGQRPHDCLEDMASHYLREIREAQPQGPYLLAGWSLGGLIAIEVARQLQAIEQQAALVAMFDTYLSVTDFESQNVTDPAVFRWIAPHLNLSIAELTKLPLERQWDRIAEQAQKAHGLGIAEIFRLAEVCKSHLRAASRYKPQPYDGRVVLFQAETSRGRLDSRWKSLCPNMHIEQVPGDHYSMLQKPQVDVLAKQLKRHIEDTGEGKAGKRIPPMLF